MGSKPKIILRGAKVVGKALLAILMAGGILVTGAVAPNLFVMIQKFIDQKDAWTRDSRKREKKVYDSFRYLLRRGMVQTEYRGKQLYISLTPEGKRLAKKYSIDSLGIKRSEHWKETWYMILFDVEEKRKITREALRGKLKELGFFQAQKSFWIHAFPCEKEVKILRDFFGLKESQCVCCEARKLPEEIEENAKKYFGIG